MPYRIVILLLSLCILNCCQKKFEKPADNNTLTPDIADFRAKVNGIDFVAVITGAVIRPNDNVISIAAEANDGQKIVFAVKDSGVHVYKLPVNSTSSVGTYTSAVSIAFSSNEGFNPGDSGGVLEITSLDRVKKLISGVFSFKGFHADDRTQRAITDGVFKNVSY